MPIHIDPQTRQRVIFDKRDKDIVYFADGDESIANETVSVVGPFQDYTGSTDVNSRTQQQWAGITNSLEGTDPGIMGVIIPQLNSVGQVAGTTRRRIKRKMVNLKSKRR